MKRLLLLLALGFATATQTMATEIQDLDRRYDQYTWLTTHNAFNVGFGGNQNRSIPEQLGDGVRGLMIDIHDDNGRAIVCHSCYTGGPYFADVLGKQIVPFLHANPEAVVMIHLDDFASRETLHREFDNVPGLAPLTFNPDTWKTDQWPTLRQMIATGQRLLIFDIPKNTQTNTGDYETPDGNVHVMAGDEATVENYWSLGLTQWMHDFSCYSRWKPRIPLTTGTVAWEDKSWNRLFVMNQFHGVAFTADAKFDNSMEALMDRFENYCFPAAGRKPNYVAIDRYDIGDGKAFVKALNEGTIGPREH
ncbi:hypothetical protein EC912_102567 [Luteibacter rhizovicinus]|uniref:Calcium-dependent phosphoinositide phospholipase C n=1 Tax=Luteibacter rhizovicinus TaxID=242606 RepID=A0A4R3YTF5_9GAMM|nr:hypothetical protein [Luteibacter rhizovicinus]TCV96217.1 hypothetical protein EC912_102567 [Luteibacter rhizovicinus]